MKRVIGSHVRITGFSLVLSAAFFVAGAAAAAQANSNHSTPPGASAYFAAAHSTRILLSEADQTPLGTDERDRTPGISHKEWLENKKLEKEKEKDKEKEKAAGSKPTDSKAAGKSVDSKPTDSKAAGKPAEPKSTDTKAAGKSVDPKATDAKDAKEAPADAQKLPPLLRKEQDDPKAQAPDKTAPSSDGKSEARVKSDKKAKSESDPKSKSADDKTSTEKPAEHHRFGWQGRP